MENLSLKTPLSGIEHRVFNKLKKGEVAGRSLLLCVSGGVDSMAMAQMMVRLQPLLKTKLALAHVYHGLSENPQQNEYREQALSVSKRFAEAKSLSFFTNEMPYVREGWPKNSEGELRKFRYKALRNILGDWSPGGLLCLAQHQDDLLETRLIRLIRGTGEGGLEAICLLRDDCLRPFLGETKKELLTYSVDIRLQWLEDPSNQIEDPLRNWLRNSWLPALEEKRSGGVKALGNSLQSLVDEALSQEEQGEFEVIREGAIDNPMFLELSREQQKRVLARYMRQENVKAYGRSHIEEILKRLDTFEKNHKFLMLRRNWVVSPDWIKAVSLPGNQDR